VGMIPVICIGMVLAFPCCLMAFLHITFHNPRHKA
jgi:hypothetical protein